MSDGWVWFISVTSMVVALASVALSIAADRRIKRNRRAELERLNRMVEICAEHGDSR